MRLCESEKHYRTLERDGSLRDAIRAYSIGSRSTDVLSTLAHAHVWAQDIGDWVPLPVLYDRSTWTDILDDLVWHRLGNRRCLDCGKFFSDQRPNGTCFVYPLSDVPFCPNCGGTVNEAIGRAADVVR